MCFINGLCVFLESDFLLVRSCFLITDEMSQRSQVSRVTLFFGSRMDIGRYRAVSAHCHLGQLIKRDMYQEICCATLFLGREENNLFVRFLIWLDWTRNSTRIGHI